jgi:hypothetical protein
VEVERQDKEMQEGLQLDLPLHMEIMEEVAGHLQQEEMHQQQDHHHQLE